ncbi:BppU family phage baseplate upper protein [Staphylococcus haemolyticus]|uniref:BppU family phage baseplate upper protein n=1 Tax=Staphylococcus haemolyticus TaxID=1283 RepID=UPI0027F400DD|nr:BppU family phage baseplate upper protein [Staphylococcus haemolyticus]MDQ7230056.1 BppU family phage baseplate upper protein [Staphylococcus haemolyticus]
MLQKMTDVSTNINVSTAENGFIGANFYTEDDGSAYIRITIKDNNQVLDFNKTDMLPRLDLFCSDGSIFTNEPLDILIPDKGVIQYKVSDNVIAHPGRMDAKLFLANKNDSIHVANFYFTITDSGMTGPIGKEVHVDSLKRLVQDVMRQNSLGLLDDKFLSKVQTDLKSYVQDNDELFKGDKGDKGDVGEQGPKGDKGEIGPQGVQGSPGKDGINGVDGIDGKPGIDGKDGADGAKGEPFRYDDFTPEQLEALRGPQGLPGPKLLYSDLSETEKKELKDALNNTAITDVQIQDKTITNQKLSDQYNTVKVLEANEDITKINREGLYFLSSNTSYVGVPEAVNVATFSGILRVSAYSQYHYTQEIHDLNNNGVFYSRVIKNNVNTKWKSYLDEEKLKVISNEQTNNKLMYNLNVFEKYANEVIPDKNIVYANAIQDIRIEGVDKKTPVKIWMLSRAFGTWNYRIILGQKVNGVWSTLLDTGNNFMVTENAIGATTISYEKNGIKLTARVDYNLIPKNDRLLDHSTVTDDPYFIIRQEKIGSVATGGGGTAYDQSLNTTDSVKFASIKTDALDVSGTMPSGTLSQPPKVSKGDMWLDTTDSATHPIVRVML